MIRLLCDALRCYRSARGITFSSGVALRRGALIASSAAIAAWVGLIIAGLAEYNFGDSEVLTLFLFVVSAPYAFLPQRTGKASPEFQEIPPSSISPSDPG